MIRHRILAAVAVAAALAGLTVYTVSRAGQEQAAPGQSDELRDLRKRVEKLEARVAELEQRAPRVIVPAQGVPQLRVVPEGRLDGQPVPKNWIPREFNGQRYYDIPLETPPQPK
jgi:hypothetical protein